MDLTYGERVVDPEQGVTQEALARYYAAVATAMLPHVVGRPLSVVRRGGAVPHDTIGDERGLMALVEEFALEIQTASAHASDPERPDRLIFELVPGHGVAFAEVARAAKVLRALFHGLDLESFAMTRGPSGLDVMVPIVAELGWDDVHEFEALVAKTLAAAAPERYATSSDAAANDKIHIGGAGQRGATFVAPYSTQLLGNALVALPAFWHELESIEPAALTPTEVAERVEALPSDPWERAVGLEQRLTVERRRALARALQHSLAAV
jgi:bifunctional non-homologous end joining protein LigD